LQLVFCVDKILPSDIFVLGESALLTGGQEYQQAVDEEKEFVVRNAQICEERFENGRLETHPESLPGDCPHQFRQAELGN